jgi:Zn-dependent carboxypeptidase
LTSAYQELSKTFQRLARFGHLGAIAGVDMQTTMPPGGSQARGEAMAELSVFLHELLTDKRLGGLFDAAQQESLNDVEQANLSEMQRAWQQATILPASLVEAKSLAGSRCEHAWRQQRPANDWQGFSANLKEVVKLSREEAQLRAEALGVSRYDALLDVFEPGMTSAQLDNTFGELKSWLPALLQKAVEKQQKTAIAAPVGPFAVEAQNSSV